MPTPRRVAVRVVAAAAAVAAGSLGSVVVVVGTGRESMRDPKEKGENAKEPVPDSRPGRTWSVSPDRASNSLMVESCPPLFRPGRLAHDKEMGDGDSRGEYHPPLAMTALIPRIPLINRHPLQHAHPFIFAPAYDVESVQAVFNGLNGVGWGGGRGARVWCRVGIGKRLLRLLLLLLWLELLGLLLLLLV